jgi:hypothetical protein
MEYCIFISEDNPPNPVPKIIPISGFSFVLLEIKLAVSFINFKTEFDGVKLFYIPINIKIDREQEFKTLITNYVKNHKRNR